MKFLFLIQQEKLELYSSLRHLISLYNTLFPQTTYSCLLYHTDTTVIKFFISLGNLKWVEDFFCVLSIFLAMCPSVCVCVSLSIPCPSHSLHLLLSLPFVCLFSLIFLIISYCSIYLFFSYEPFFRNWGRRRVR